MHNLPIYIIVSFYHEQEAVIWESDDFDLALQTLTYYKSTVHINGPCYYIKIKRPHESKT